MEHFQKLPEEMVWEIMGRTSPVDAARSAVISKWFKSVADSDVVWGRLLPSDWTEIVSRSVSPMVYATKKELCISLCRTPIFLDDGTLGFFVDKSSGKKCYIVEAKTVESSYGLDIKGRINVRMLSPNTNYGAYLVYKLDWYTGGMRSLNTLVRTRLVDHNEDEDEDEDRDSAAAAAVIADTVVHLILPSARYRRSMQLINATLPLIRVDGCLEIHMGSFFNNHGHETHEVEARIMEIHNCRKTYGLIVQAIDFRPN